MEQEAGSGKPSVADLTRRVGTSVLVHVYSVAVRESYKINALDSTPIAESEPSIFFRGILHGSGYRTSGEVINVEVCRDYRSHGDFQYGDRGPMIGEIMRFSDEVMRGWDREEINGVKALERFSATVLVDAPTLDRIRTAAMSPLAASSRILLDLKIVDFDRLPDLGEDEFLELTQLTVRRIECPAIDVQPRDYADKV